jgi:hypothetical protein
VFHELRHQSNSSRKQGPAVANFYSAAEHRSRGALWPSFAPARIPEHLHLFSVEQLRQMAANAGCSRVTFEHVLNHRIMLCQTT